MNAQIHSSVPLDISHHLSKDHADIHPIDGSPKHSYSCKRCRRLKKKCTRTMPECQNCNKAGENCEYVPRAPRRKKVEVIKSLQDRKAVSTIQQQQQQHEQHPPPTSSSSSSSSIKTDLTHTTSVTSNTSSTLHNLHNHTHHLSNPQYNKLQPLNLDGFPKVLPNSSTIKSQIGYGPTLPVYTSSEANYRYGSLPPISSITGSMLPTNTTMTATPTTSTPSNNNINTSSHEKLQQSPHQYSFPSIQLPRTRFTQTTETPSNGKTITTTPFYPSSLDRSSNTSISNILNHSNSPTPYNNINDDSKINQNHILTSALGLTNRSTERVPPPEINVSLIHQCINAFFNEVSRPYPFLKKNDYIGKLNKFDLKQLDRMDSKDTFDIYIIVLIGYRSLERKNKFPSNITLKKYLNYKSLDQIDQVLTFHDLSSLKNLLLLGIYSFFDKNGLNSWYLSGLINRLVYHLGLNRCLKHGGKSNSMITQEEKEWRNRIFWSAYNFDRQVCSSLGRRPCGGLDDDDIDTESPKIFAFDDPDEIHLLNSIISLRRLEGEIYQKIHSVQSGKSIQSMIGKNDFLQSYKDKIEKWFMDSSLITSNEKRLKLSKCTISWYSLSYHQLLILLFKPSFLQPLPNSKDLLVVKNSITQSLKDCNSLHQIHLLPLNWLYLYRLINICTSLLYCLLHQIHEGVAIEQQFGQDFDSSIELLEFFSDDWNVSQLLNIFKKITQLINLVDNDQLDNDQLKLQLTKLYNDYHDALNENQNDLLIDDPIRFAVSL